MKPLLVSLVSILLFVGTCIAEDVLLKRSTLLVTGYSILPIEAPVKILFRDSSLVISAGGPDTDYRDLTIIPYQDVRALEFGEYRQGNESAAILISPLFALHFSQKRLFSLSYVAQDSVRVLNIFLAGKDKIPFIQEIEKRTGKKTVTSFPEAPTFTHFKILMSDKHGDFFQAPVSVVVRDISLLVFVSDLTNSFQDKITVPFGNIQSIGLGVREEPRSELGLIAAPLALLKSKKPTLSIAYAARDTTKSIVLVLNEDERDKFIETIEKKIGKKIETIETEMGKKVESKSENTATTKASGTDLKVAVPVTSEPPGADIYVDEVFRGSTPSTISLIPGDHSIRITRPGYVTWERKVQIEPSGSMTLNAVLEKDRSK